VVIDVVIQPVGFWDNGSITFCLACGSPAGVDVRVGDRCHQTQFCTWVRPAIGVRRIDRILSQWTK
jgi:microcystin degradation protein MlrC